MEDITPILFCGHAILTSIHGLLTIGYWSEGDARMFRLHAAFAAFWFLRLTINMVRLVD